MTANEIISGNYFYLYDFAYLRDETVCLEILKCLAMPEEWEWNSSRNAFDSRKNAILFRYLHFTFNRIWEEYNLARTQEDKQKKIAMSERCACFNTGLLTKNYSPIFMFFERNQNEDRQPWFFKDFFSGSVPKEFKDLPLPERANYFKHPEELFYDCRLPIKVDVDHIFSEENFTRFPEYLREKYSTGALRNLFNGAVINTERRLAANYRIAVPQYFNGAVQLLVPIDLESKGSADFALAIFKANGFYSARTCLTLEMAYSNARLIAKLEGEWLRP